MKKMIKKAIAILICAMTVFSLTPAAFAADFSGQVETDYTYNAEDDFNFIDDKTLINGEMVREDVDENLSVCPVLFGRCISFMFESNGKKQVIEMMKGQYGFILVGAEVGVYIADADAGSYSDFTFADDSEMIEIQLDCLWDKNGDGEYEQIFSTPQDEYRFANAFREGVLSSFSDSASELATVTKFSFDSEETAKSFAKAVKGKGFTEVLDSEYLVADTFCAEGAEVTLMWKLLENELPYAVYSLENSQLTMAPDKTEALVINVEGTELRKPECDFESSDESVATVDENGVVTAVDYGAAEIYVRVNGELIGICNVNVEDGSIRCAYEKVKNAVIGFVADYMLKILVFYYR